MASKPSRNVLQEIVEHKRNEIAQRKAQNPVEHLNKDLTASDRSLHEALARPGSRFIMEYKKASPSRGLIRPDLSVDELVEAYKPCADAISVLTDTKYFSGVHEDLRLVREKVSQPVLCKDFFIDDYQIFEARYYGADAILLMLSVLTDEEYKNLSEVAKSLKLDVLTEVHTEQECKRAVELGAEIIGVNNRDLRSLTTDLNVTEALASLIPDDRLLVSESGISNRQDIARLAPYADAFLVGSSLMSADDIGQAAKALTYGKVKLCGVANVDEAKAAFSNGASMVGFMFYTKSARVIDVTRAADIVKQQPGKYVGVFVDETEEKIVETTHRCQLASVQLHGNEPVEFCQTLRHSLPENVELIKAVRVKDEASVRDAAAYIEVCDKLLFDYKHPTELGGSGDAFDWDLVDNIRTLISDDRKIMIAGGINQNNVHQLFKFSDITLDLSSGVERQKGRKDIHMIKEFFESLRMIGRLETKVLCEV
ncbi:bifunctional indole-3-glycerol-phosphate synthase TrpC/phosphoribosylanthranilate isomerase TrpF [Pleionea sp. CnH1-48]|uniref:bifunctional indole-3-glycerol-phosphate synthase TrpC/phosphoribosylanthranilate isomerase TrpF n=1 Tax=Pleionea sp. CnH1-48 TaxID=2954494 RepID=UPI002097841E|nr:bifunctional indole-3-glycerol-phosphate synthase TrpC/phosphoribosylanthranilate isomerase TrpF [Pleionea sp. CnH1-48]MCO7223099.1 bifunctional indole-3-glycerol-phosphate synthase TrpC/phosphoribosylanthranilate isomerase TrpF [Pleionea sp. CnH1-48]